MDNKTNNFSKKGTFNKKQNGFANDLSNEMGKLPPQSIPLEEAILGALLLEKKAFEDVVDILKADSFYKDAHKLIFQSMLELSAKGSPIDLLTVRTQLEKNGTLEIVGGAYALVRLTTEVSSSSNVVYHAHEIVERAIKRKMIGVASTVRQNAFEDTTDAFELLDETQHELFEITEDNVRKRTSDMASVYLTTLKDLEEKRKNKTGITGIQSGFTALDRITAGWQRSDLIILAARPGMGKTAFVLSALANAAVKYDHCVVIFSLEMSAEQLLTRMMSSEAEVESQKLRNGSIADHEWAQLIHRTTRLSAAKIFIDDTPAITMLELRAKARRLKSQHNLNMIVIDYLQLMSGDSGKGGGNREQEIAGISRALKQLAKELDVPVMALSQLSRAVETRGGDKKPMLSDLRESGCLVAETQIIEAHTGKIFTIKQLADRKEQIPFYCLALGNDKKIRPYLMSKVFYSGIKQTFQLITRSGKSIKASTNHPFLKLEGEKEKWTALENLNIGDRIGTPKNKQNSKVENNENLNENLFLENELNYDNSNYSTSQNHFNQITVLEKEQIKTKIDYVKSDIFWDEIAQIIPLEEEHVFDATVPEVHNFVANDIIVHNSIEQDADMVIFLYRPEYYDITQDEHGNPTHGTAEVIIAKNRHGSLETVKLQFVGKYTKFQDLDEGGFSQGNTGYDSGFPNAHDNLSNMPMDDGFTTLPSKGNNMKIDDDLKNKQNNTDFGDEPPF